MKKTALDIHKKSFIVDLHCDTVWKVFEGCDIALDNDKTQIDIPKLKRGGINLQVFAVWINPKHAPHHCASRALVLIDTIYMLIGNNRYLTLVKNYKRLSGLKDKIGVLLAIEGGDAIEDKIELLRNFYRLGVRILTLTWNNSNLIGDAALDRTKLHNGLSNFGKKVVKEMNRLGMIIDIAHSSEETFWDVYETSTAPFIASHIGAYAVRRHKRNLKDDQIKAIAQRGGIIGVFFLPQYISKKLPATVKDVADHIDHIREVGGINVLALGSDFDGMAKRTKGLEDAGKLPALTEELIKRGYTETEIKKILGENFLNFIKSFR